jgi:hypothetical protein
MKHVRRSLVSNLLFCLLLTMAGTLLCISAAMWFSAHNALRTIDASITTIAVPNAAALRKEALKYIAEYQAEHGEGAIDPDYTHEYWFGPWGHPEQHIVWNFETLERDISHRLRDAVYSSGLLRMDERRIFNAVSDGIETIPLRTSGIGLEPQLAANSPHSVAAFIVTCEIIEVDHWHLWTGEDTVQREYNAVFTVEEVLRLHSSFREPKTIRISFRMNADGFSPFERKKQYAVMGRYDQAGFGLSSLHIDDMWNDAFRAVVDQVHTHDELSALIKDTWRWSYVPPDAFPVDVVEWRFSGDLTAGRQGHYVFELEGGLDEALASGQWAPVKEAVESINISAGSFQILTTNHPNSLFRFNQRRNIIAEGRLFSDREIRDGARVCLVSARFADHNGLSVGDVLPLEIYNAVLGMTSVTYMAGEDGTMATRSFWAPSWYSPDLEISEPVEYTIVGIYNTLTLDFGDYAIFPGTVVIPDRSFGVLSGEPESKFTLHRHTPLLADGMIVPNGRIEETMAVLNGIAEGYGGMFRFYDQGYETVVTSLRNMRWGMSWVLALAATGWIVVAFMFSMFYIARKRTETSVLYALGVNRKRRFGWVFVQCAALIFIALGFSLAAALPLYSDIIDAAGGAAEEFTVSFRNLTLSDAADSGVRGRIPLDKSPLAMIVIAAGATALLLGASGAMSARAAHFSSLGAMKEED